MKKSLSLVLFFLLLLSAKAQVPGQTDIRSAQGNFNQYLTQTVVKDLEAKKGKKSGIITAFNNDENTTGTRFLFDTWVKGDSVIGVAGNYINTLTFLFNFDKMTGNLLVTQDKINIMSAAPSGISSFVLKNNGQQYAFEHANVIDPQKFFQALVKNETQYSLYKLISVEFKAANVRNDGVIKTGSELNEFKDATEYYIVDKKTNTSSLASFKPKALKAALKADSEKTEAYFNKHKGEAIDERFLIGLVSSLNQ